MPYFWARSVPRTTPPSLHADETSRGSRWTKIVAMSAAKQGDKMPQMWPFASY